MKLITNNYSKYQSIPVVRFLEETNPTPSCIEPVYVIYIMCLTLHCIN